MKNIIIEDNIYKSLLKQDAKFLRNVYKTEMNYYKNRLESLNFTNKKNVLDAGCGFGQWSFVLAHNNTSVTGIDYSDIRIKTANEIRVANQIDNLDFIQGSLEALPFDDETFDAIFSYSVIYHTNHIKSILEMIRVLKKGGILYLNFNGMGWFLHLIVNRGILKLNFENTKKGLLALYNTLMKKNSIHGISKNEIIKLLQEHDMEILGSGGDGEVSFNGEVNKRFYQKKYFGFDGVVEIIAKKEV